MMNYLKQYSRQLTQLAESLKQLLRNDTIWCSETKQQKFLEAIKDELIKTPVLEYFDPKADHIIQVDRSMKGNGAVLLQKGRPVMYASGTLMPAETGYFNIERELLSVVFGLETLHHHVFCSKIKVQTDDKPLGSM